MKKSILLLAAAFLLGSCVEGIVEENYNGSLNGAAPSDLTAGFADEESRTYVADGKYMRWHEGDLISAFYGNTLNRQYKFKGKTGSNSGTFSLVPSGELGTGNALNAIYAIYPYDEAFEITDEGVISFSLPAQQSYAENSFGKGANTMIAVTENVEDTFLGFKNCCGYLKVQLYGNDVTLKSVALIANKGEKIAGDATATMVFGEAPTVAMASSGSSTITVDCGDGVQLSNSAETPTAFWFVVPPTTFEEGFTIFATDVDGYTYVKSTSKNYTIERNVVQPMVAINISADMEAMDPNLPPYNEIWYTTTDGNAIAPRGSFGAKIVSNTYENGKGVIKFDGIVRSIGENAFHNEYSATAFQRLKSVTIPKSVTTIGALAFRYCTNLESINLHDDITSIGERAFIYTNLTEVNIPKKMTVLSQQVFDSTPLKSVVIPDNITTIEERAFSLCSELETVVIGDGVTTIGLCAFEIWSSSMKQITLGRNVVNMASSVFYGCTGKLVIQKNIPDVQVNDWTYGAKFTEVVFGDEVEAIPAKLFGGNSTYYVTEITIGNGVKSIGANALSRLPLTKVNIKSLATWCNIDFDGYGANPLSNGAAALYLNGQLVNALTIPDSVTAVKPYAFYKYGKVTHVNIGAKVSSIGVNAFYNCTSLGSIIFSNSVTSIGDYAFYNCTSLHSISNLTSPATIGKSAFYGCTALHMYNSSELKKVTSIGDYAFYNCSEIYTLDISNATTIGEYAFRYCTNIRSVTLNGSLKRIEDGTFGSNTSLASIELPKSLTYIGEESFNYCRSLTSLTIPESVTYIGYEAFYGCRSLASVYCKPTTPPTAGTYYDDGSRYWSAFVDLPSDFKLYVPQTSFETYKTTTYWKNYSNAMVSYDFVNNKVVVNIPSNEVWYTTTDNKQLNLTWVDSNYNSIITSHTFGTRADGVVGGIVKCSSALTKLPDNAFAGCSTLSSVSFSDNLTTIGQYAFQYCTSLTSFPSGNNIKYVNYAAFTDCTGLKVIVIPDTVLTIGDYAFRDCKTNKVTIGSKVTSIGSLAFSGHSMTAVYCKAATPPTVPTSVMSFPFNYSSSNSYKGFPLYVPSASYSKYADESLSNRWRDFETIYSYNF